MHVEALATERDADLCIRFDFERGPVPRQLWPTKYADVGASWVTNEYPGLGHLSEREWMLGVGWVPLAGSTARAISDLWGEFSWGAVLAMNCR